MTKYLKIIVVYISIAFGLSDDIPYDWSGQYGVITNDGRLMWNQDWTVGVLLIDGTFANYPTRFGTSYKNNFELLYVSDYYQSLHSFPDSFQIKSRIDYYRGDFSYDQLEIDAKFAEKDRVIGLNGFKRTYKGPYGQYSDLQGDKNPLQQSYRIDYSSVDKDENLSVSIGHFITNSGLNLSDPTDFSHNEKIVAIGIGYSKDLANWQYNIHGALFQQYYSMNIDSIKAYMNRFHLNQFISKKIKDSDFLKFGLEFDNQRLSLVDTTKKDRSWTVIYGGWEKQTVGFKLGTTISKNELIPYLNVSAELGKGKTIKWQSYFRYSAVPSNLLLWNKTNDNLFERWITVHTGTQIQWKKIPLNISIDYFHNQNTAIVHKYYISDELKEISNNLLTNSLSTQIPIFRGWEIDAQYRHTFKHNYYSDGVGDKVQFGIKVTERFFKNNLLAHMRLYCNAYLNHNQNLGYEGFHYGPYMTDNINLVLPDYWVFNLEISAKISKMTIMWKVNNILQTAESITKQLFPHVNKNYLLITNSNNFPPMNRFVSFNILWNFEN